MEIVIPCDAIARLSVLLADPADGTEECFTHFRIERNLLIATNKHFMAIEKIWGTEIEGHVYLKPAPALIEACRNEAKYKGNLQISIVPQVKLSNAKTTLGVNFTDCINWDIAQDARFNYWRTVVNDARSVKSAQGPICINTPLLEKLAIASPSGILVFAELVDVNKPTLVRDAQDDSWIGIFQPKVSAEKYKAAVMPHWWKD